MLANKMKPYGWVNGYDMYTKIVPAQPTRMLNRYFLNDSIPNTCRLYYVVKWKIVCSCNLPLIILCVFFTLLIPLISQPSSATLLSTQIQYVLMEPIPLIKGTAYNQIHTREYRILIWNLMYM